MNHKIFSHQRKNFSPSSRCSSSHGGQRSRSSGHGENFESHGPEGKVRGNFARLAEKYLLRGKELVGQDPVLAERFFQHAEHFARMQKAFSHKGGENNRGFSKNSEKTKEEIDTEKPGKKVQNRGREVKNSEESLMPLDVDDSPKEDICLTGPSAVKKRPKTQRSGRKKTSESVGKKTDTLEIIPDEYDDDDGDMFI